MKRVLKILISVKLLFLFVLAGWSDVPIPSLKAPDYIDDYAGRLESLSVPDLITLSLQLSGTPREEMDGLIRRFVRLCEELDPSMQAEGILTFMHTEVLKKYSEKQTRMDVLLKEGIFNCVSSSVLYLILARSLDLNVWGIKTIDHAFCRVSTPEKDYDVETTNPFGFNPGEKKQFTDEFGNVTGFNYVPPGDYRDRSEISLVQLMGLILQNRITFLTEKRQFAAASELAVEYWTLLRDEESREVLINACLNMWNVYNSSAGFLPGIAYYDAVIRMYGEDEKLAGTRTNLVHNYLVTLIEADRLVEARHFLDQREAGGLILLEELKKYNLMITVKEVQILASTSYSEAINMINTVMTRFGQDKDLLGLKNTYVHNLVVEKIQNDELAEAYKFAGEFRSAGDLSEMEWKELVVFIYQKRAQLYQADYLKAADILATGLAEVGENRELRKQFEAYIYNYEISVHNEMVSLYNKRSFTAARTLLEGALEKVPGSKHLQEDLDMILEVMANQ